MADDEPKKKNPIGDTGKTVARNVKRLRESQRLAFTELAAKLEAIGKPIPTLGLRHIEADKRRVDSDDLVSLAVALQVSPITLLMPPSETPDAVVSATGTGELSAQALFAWLQGNAPLPQQLRSASMPHTLPDWHIEADLQRLKFDIDQQADLANRIFAMEEEIKKLQARGDH